jgi:hypothetical protein
MTSNEEATTYENQTVSSAPTSTRKSSTSGSEKRLICCVHGIKCKYGRREDREKRKNERQNRANQGERNERQSKRQSESDQASFTTVEYYLGAMSRKEVCVFEFV